MCLLSLLLLLAVWLYPRSTASPIRRCRFAPSLRLFLPLVPRSHFLPRSLSRSLSRAHRSTQIESRTDRGVSARFSDRILTVEVTYVGMLDVTVKISRVAHRVGGEESLAVARTGAPTARRHFPFRCGHESDWLFRKRASRATAETHSSCRSMELLAPVLARQSAHRYRASPIIRAPRFAFSRSRGLDQAAGCSRVSFLAS